MSVELPPKAAPQSMEAIAYTLRCQALDLLEATADAGLPSETRSAVVERLQRVGNDLQVAATQLGELASLSPTRPRCTRATAPTRHRHRTPPSCWRWP